MTLEENATIYEILSSYHSKVERVHEECDKWRDSKHTKEEFRNLPALSDKKHASNISAYIEYKRGLLLSSLSLSLAEAFLSNGYTDLAKTFFDAATANSSFAQTNLLHLQTMSSNPEQYYEGLPFDIEEI